MADESDRAQKHPSRFEVRYSKVRAPPALVVALGAPVVLALVFLLVLAPGVVTIAGAAMVAGALAWFAQRTPPMLVDLELDGYEVILGVERLTTRGELGAAVVIEGEADARVELRTRKRSLVTLHLEDRAEARRLVDALGFSPGGRITAVEIPGTPWARAALLAIALGAAALGGGELAAHARLPLAILWATFCMVMAVAAQPLTTQLVEVGADGVRLTSRGRERFVPFGDIASVTASRGPIASLRLRLTSGRSLRIDLGSRPGANKGLAAGLADLIKRSKENAGKRESVEGRLERRGREARSWLRDLRTLGAGADAEHRRAPATDEALWRTLSAPETNGVERAAAAVALAGDPGRRGELLRVADSVASPRVRIAIARAAEGLDDDDALAEALLEVEREEKKIRRR
jgi:hypothetical protein